MAIRPFVRELIPYRIPANIVMTTLTLLVMSPFLKALIGWNIITTKFIKNKMQWLFPQKQSDEDIEAAKELAEANRNPTKVETFRAAAQNVIDEKTSRLRDFFADKNQVSHIYYKLWMAKKANRLPLIILTSFRILVSSFFIVTVVHKFLSQNQRLTLVLLVLTIFFVFRSRWLLDRYLRIESQFLRNLKGREKEEDNNEAEKTAAE